MGAPLSRPDFFVLSSTTLTCPGKPEVSVARSEAVVVVRSVPSSALRREVPIRIRIAAISNLAVKSNSSDRSAGDPLPLDSVVTAPCSDITIARSAI